jgi:phosphatidylglycerophosphate synthase
MEPPSSRRPLKSRSAAWAAWAAGWLTRSGATPNAISAASVVMALFGSAAFLAAGFAWIQPVLGWVLGAAMVQLRLICNLLDGMVAIEGGKKSPTGGIWNEAPDRLADTMFLVSAGVACGAPWAGVTAAWASVMTAYVRSLGAELTGAQDFCGPFAKPHRMAALTVAALLTPLGGLWGNRPEIMPIALWIIAGGTFLTIIRRLRRLAQTLHSTSE